MRLIPVPIETQARLGFTHKVIINYTDFTAAGTTQTIQIFPSLTPADEMNANPTSDYLAAGVCLGPVMINLITPFTGPSLSAMVVAIGDPTSSTRYLNSTGTDLFTALASNTKSTGMGTVTYTYNGSDVANNYGALQALFTSTACNLNALTAGQVEIYFQRRDIYRLQYVGQP